MNRAAALLVAGFASAFAAPAHAQTARPTLFVEAASGFVPFAIDVPLMIGAGLRLGGVHEIWARAGYMPTGDDVGLGFGCGGYRAVLRPGKLVRPVVGALVAGLPATCTHDALRRPVCTDTPLFIFAGVAGVRFEPAPWLGVSSLISLGTDSYPNPFGMMEIDVTLLLPAM